MADPMTPERLAEIREREQAALSPTWTVVRDDHGSKGREIAIWAEEPSGYGYVTENLGTIRDADAEFIAHARQDVPALLDEVERLRAERTRAVDALGDIGRTAEATSGDLEDGINAELLAAHAENEQLRAELARERETSETLRWSLSHFTKKGMEREQDLLARQREAEAERDEARAELTEIRQHAETTGGVLYDVIRRTLRGDLDEHQAVRQIERRLIQPLTAQRRDAEARAARAAGRRQHAAKEREKHGQEIAEVTAERDRLAEQVKRVRARHYPVCSGACGCDDTCECGDRDLICAEDNDRWPCPTNRALDGTEATS